MKLFETCYESNMQLEALKQADYFRQCSYAGLSSFMFPGKWWSGDIWYLLALASGLSPVQAGKLCYNYFIPPA